jgi:cold shock CspA family protein
MHGIVIAFDERRGDGIFRDDEGSEWYFHCLAIANGSRRIEVGTAVRAQRGVGRRGRDEAVNLEEI